MSSATLHGFIRPAVIGSFVVVCVLGTFFMYYTPIIKLLPCSADQASQKGKALCACPGVQQERNKTQVPNQTPETHDQHAQTQSEDRDKDTIALIWMWPFGVKFDLGTCASYKGCRLTADRSLYHKAHVVIFHHRDIDWNLKDMPKEPRPWFQKWVWYNMESPTYTNRIPALDNMFNLTASYRLSSEIDASYGLIVGVTSDDKRFELPKKDKLVCWVVSHWNTQHKRVPVFNELNKHVKVETFGRHFDKYIEDKGKIVSSCKFYLAFENSLHQDYMTEKLFGALTLGTVPIVLGPPRQNYEAVIQGDSFIHVDDFSSQKELADWLLFLDKNDTEYLKYFNWRKNFKVDGHSENILCRACDYVQKNKGYRVFHNLNTWFWG